MTHTIQSRHDAAIVFAWIWSAFCQFHILRYLYESNAWPPNFFYFVATGISLILLVRPSFIWLFAAASTSGLIATWLSLPVPSNHTIMRLLILLAMVGSFMQMILANRSLVLTWEDFYRYFAPVGKMILLIMYFYGVFHKLNWDYLEPATSCAVHMWKLYPLPFGLTDMLWTQYSAIYGSILIELVIVIMLLVPRLKYPGLIIALLFHMALGLNTYRFFPAFSSMTFALHFLFLPADFYSRLRSGKIAAFLLTARGRYGAALVGAVFMGVVISLYPTSLPMIARCLWFVLGGGCILLVILYGRAQPLDRSEIFNLISPALWLNIIPLMLFLNGLTPYIGYKTEQSLNMFSNLYTEEGRTNHILMSKPPYLFDEQSKTVEILASSLPWLNAIQEKKMKLTYHGFRDFVSREAMRNPDMAGDMYVRYKMNDQKYIIQNGKAPAGDPDILTPYPVWERKLVRFHLISSQRPQSCSSIIPYDYVVK